MSKSIITDVLPSIPKRCRAIFEREAKPVTEAGVPILKKRLDDYYEIVSSQAKKNTCIRLDTVEAMMRVFNILLSRYHHFSLEHKALIVGAISYFIAEEDANSDLIDMFGFEDDLAVLNTVLMTIGQDDLVIAQVDK